MDYDESTSNLNRHFKSCEGKKAPEGQTIDDYAHGIKYSATRVRYLLTLWCARRHRPFTIMEDPEFRELLRMLYPKVKVPSRKTVSRDVRKIVVDGRERVQAKLLSHPGKLHICVDGWTSPNVIAFLGVTVHWQEVHEIQHLILDFIKYAPPFPFFVSATLFTFCMEHLGSRRPTMAHISGPS